MWLSCHLLPMKRLWCAPTQGLAKEGCGQAMVKPDGAPVYPGNEANQALPSFLSTDLVFLTLWGAISHSQRVVLERGLLSRLATHGAACSPSVHTLTGLSRRIPDITPTQEAELPRRALAPGDRAAVRTQLHSGRQTPPGAQRASRGLSLFCSHVGERL